MDRIFQYDVFVSHSSKDKARVRALAERMRNDGVRVWFDEWEIQYGDDIYLKVEQGLESSRALVLTMSPFVFDSDWVTMERNTAVFRDPINRQRRFIPLLLEDCDIPDTIRRFRYIDWRSEDTEAYNKLVNILRSIPNSTSNTSSSSLTPYNLIEIAPNVIAPHSHISTFSEVAHATQSTKDSTQTCQLFSFPNGGSPQKLVYSNNILFVSNWGSSNVMLIDPNEKSVLGVIELDSYEAGELALPSEKWKFGNAAVVRRYPPGDMAVVNGKLLIGQVFSEFLLVVDIESKAIVKRIAVGGEGNLAVSPDGSNIYFASNTRPEFYIIDTTTYKYDVVPYPSSGRGIGCIFAHPDKHKLYLGIQRGDSSGVPIQGGHSFIAVYDLVSGTYTEKINLAEINGGVSDDSWPVCMTYSQDDNILYIGMIQSRKGIYLLDTNNDSIVGNIPFLPNARNKHFEWVDPLAQAIYDTHILSVNRNNYELSIVDRASRRQIAVVPLGGTGNGPNHVVIVDGEAIISHSEYDGLIFVDIPHVVRHV